MPESVTKSTSVLFIPNDACNISAASVLDNCGKGRLCGG